MTSHSLILAFLALAVVLGLIWVAQRVARAGVPLLRLPAPPGGGQVAMLQSLALDPRRRLHLVACQGRQVLLLTGGPQDVVVGWLPGAGQDAP